MQNIQHYTYRYRLYPTQSQSVLLDKHFGCVRFVYNYFLDKVMEYYRTNKEAINQKKVKGYLNFYDNLHELPSLKEREPWLKEVNSQALVAALKHLDAAYVSFFNKKTKFPAFKLKNDKQTFCIPQYAKIVGNRLYIPKFREGIKCKQHRLLEGNRIVTATVIKTKTNKYYVSITVEKSIKLLVKNKNDVGIDLGIKNLAVTSNGEVFDNKHFHKKVESKLKYLQRQASKKVKGSKNFTKAYQKVLKQYEYITNCRKDYLHKISTQLIRENQTIYIEDLNTSGLLKNKRLYASIKEMAWKSFISMLEYKAKWYGRDLIKIDRFYPSSKTCNHCGYIKQDLTLKDRVWICPRCGKEIDRDYNAAKNILQRGRNYLVKPTELSCSKVEAMK